MNNLPYKKIDVHAHYFPPAYNAMLDRRGLKFLDGGFPRPDWNEELQLASMERLGVTFSCLSVSSPHLHMGDAAEAVETARACNEYGAALQKKYPDSFGAFGALPLPELAASVEEVIYCRDTLKLSGFCLPTNANGLYLGDPALDQVMAELNKGGCIVSLHPTEPSAVPAHVNEGLPFPLMEFFFDTTRTVMNLVLNRVPQKFPNIRFIIPHAGAYLPVLCDRVAPMSGLLLPDGTPNIVDTLAGFYYDLGGVSMPKQLGNLRQLVPDTHLLYGSDTPFTPLPLCEKLAQDMDAALSADLQQLVYEENPSSIFGL